MYCKICVLKNCSVSIHIVYGFDTLFQPLKATDRVQNQLIFYFCTRKGVEYKNNSIFVPENRVNNLLILLYCILVIMMQK